MNCSLGIYEKALPINQTWRERLEQAKALGFDFVEMSIDETDERLSRLDWRKNEREEIVAAINDTGIFIQSICLSGHRRFPFGSENKETRKNADKIMIKAIDLASDIGVRNIQLAGYDVYYESKNILTRNRFIEGLQRAVKYAAKKEVMLSIEIMDDPFINSISKFIKIKQEIPSPWLQVYPDLGNLSAWPENDVGYELEIGMPYITAIHIKDTLKVTPDFGGKFKEVPFGEGCVDFDGCFETLHRLNYSGAFLIEMWSGDKLNSIDEIKQAKKYILPKLEKAGYIKEERH